MLLRNVLQRLKFPSRHRAGTNVSDPAFLDDIVQSLHDLLPWRASIQAVDLKYVNICAQSLDTLLHCIENVLPAQADFVNRLAIVYT
jgi:hypothetical protein